jgi:hypothetical protein
LEFLVPTSKKDTLFPPKLDAMMMMVLVVVVVVIDDDYALFSRCPSRFQPL